MTAGGSLVAHAIQAVRDHIRVHALKAGDPLPGEAHFAEAEDVSRAVIREAFGALAALKLIDVANGRRARVGAMDGAVLAISLDHAVSTGQVAPADIQEVYRALALQGAERAATERTDAEATEIAEVAAAGGDRAMLTAIARATRNRLLSQFLDVFAPMAAYGAGADLPALAQAIANREQAAARRLMGAYLDTNMGGKAGR